MNFPTRDGWLEGRMPVNQMERLFRDYKKVSPGAELVELWRQGTSEGIEARLCIIDDDKQVHSEICRL